MRNLRRSLKKGLSTLLMVAMLFTSVSVPEMSVNAAPAENEIVDISVEDGEVIIEESTTEVIETAETVEETTVEETTEVVEETTVEGTTETVEEVTVEAETEAVVIETPVTADVKTESGEEEETNYIVDGDFGTITSWDEETGEAVTSLGWADGKLGSWGFEGDTWNVSSVKLDTWADPDTTTTGGSTCGMAFSFNSDLTEEGTAKTYQEIETLPVGAYKMTAQVKGTSTVQLYYGDTTGTSNEVASDWLDVTYEFEVKEEATNAKVGIAITAAANGWVAIDNVSLYRTGNCATTYTLAELSTLYTTAETTIKDKTSEFYKAGWEELQTAMTTAKTLIDAESTDEAAITAAYTALAAAIKGLQLADVSFTLYYYDATGADAIGLYHYGTNITSSDSANASWNTWGDGDTWAMNAVEGYAGWYSIPVTISNGGSSSSFAISLGNEKEGYKCEFSKDDYKTVVAQLLSRTADSYAIWNNVILAGDVVATAQRNITLYVKDAEATPYIMVPKDNDALTYLDATGKETELKADEYTDSETNKYYAMTAVEGKTGWYSLSFVVPTEAPDNKVACIYSGTTWKMNLILGTPDQYGVDFTTVFDGNVYYNNGKFYSSMELADGYTLGQLRELVNSDEVAKITAKGSENYTFGWDAFNEALTAAQTLVESETYKDADTSTMDDAIISAYTTLRSAIDNLVEKEATVTLYYHNENATDEGTSLYMFTWADSMFGTTVTADSIDLGWPATAYKLTEDSGMYGDWYSIPIIVHNAAKDPTTDITKKGFDLYTYNESLDPAYVKQIEISSYKNVNVYDALLEANDETKLYFKGNKLYESIHAAEVAPLQALVKEGEDAFANKDAYKETGWDTFVSALEAAQGLLAREEAEHTEEALASAYTALETALNALEFNVISDINVKKVSLEDDFITGADFSSYVSLRDSGVVFRNQEGEELNDQEFFNMIAAGGTNWVRIRIWNDPYNGSGDGYGGGNSDLEKAIEIGKLVTNAGMRVLIDFHYSDFWADPAKQETPKAWTGYTLEEKENAIYNYTLSSLKRLKANGVDVGMVQVGNETNNGICGESTWSNMAKLFNAGSRAVKEFDENCLVAVHFTDPQDGFKTIADELETNGVNYDVFASSYYPYWHGSIEKEELQSALLEVASRGKMVMVAETSWATTWEDGDGHENTSPKASQAVNYDVSVQGQADEIRDVVNAVDSVNDTYPGAGIGVFYWEPAWISKYYAYNPDGSLNKTEYAKNQALWEKYGSGWASSYSAEYDPSDAGLWYGGSAIDNQAWFDFDGTALPTVETYKLIRSGATAALKISEVETNVSVDVTMGTEVPWDEISKVAVKYNNGTSGEATVVWNEVEKELVETDRISTYTVTGETSVTYTTTDENKNSVDVTEDYDVTLTIKIMPSGNVLDNPGFEFFVQDPEYPDDPTKTLMRSWELSYEGDEADGTTYKVFPLTTDANGNPRSGNYGMNFWRDPGEMHFTVSQTVNGLEAGNYTFGGYIQGGSADSEDVQYAVVDVYEGTVSDENRKASYRAEASLSGWMNWANPEIKNIEVKDGDIVVVGMEVNTTKSNAWGSIDDMYLYGAYDVKVQAVTNGAVNVSNLETMNGEVVTITAKPNTGYVLKEITVSGKGVTAETLDGCTSYDADTMTAAIAYDYNNDTAEELTKATFVMPASAVDVSAKFENIFAEGEEAKIVDLKDVKVSEIPVQYYNNGKAIKPTFTVSYLGYTLKANTDYIVKYDNNKKVGTATITITAKSNSKKFTGSQVIPFTISEDNRINISKFKVEFLNYDNETKKSYYYSDDYQTPDVNVYTMKKGEDGVEVKDVLNSSLYNVYYQNNKKVGKATAIIVLKPDAVGYKGSVTAKFTIAKCPANELTVIEPKSKSYTYTGKSITHNITVMNGDAVLQNGKDYTVKYTKNKDVSGVDNAGKSTTYLTIKGKGNYTGTYAEKIYFNITEKSLTDRAIDVAVSDIASATKKQSPKIVVKDGTTKLTLNKQYTYELYDAEDNLIKDGKVPAKATGTYKVVITGCKNYKDTLAAVTFQVNDKKLFLGNAKVSVKSMIYTGSAVEPVASNEKTGELVVKMNNQILTTDMYSVDCKNNIKVGKATLTITPTEAGIASGYFGSKTVSYSIKQRNITKLPDEIPEAGLVASKGYITCELVPDDIYGTTQYYTGYALKPEVEVKSVNDGKERTLTEGIDYTIQYSNNVKSGAEAKVTIKGKGNYKGQVTFTKVFTVEDRTLDDFYITVDSATYTGKKLTPAITFKDKETGVEVNLKKGTAYTVSYKYNTNVAGKDSKNVPTVTIIEKGLNAAVKKSKDKTKLVLPFTITTAKINASDVKDISVQTYKNKPVTPSVTIKVSGKKLKAGRDYVVSYTYNTYENNRGNAYVTITGIGNYTGTVKKMFIIK